MTDNYPVQGEFIFTTHQEDLNPGPSVDILQRAELIRDALSELGSISKANGFIQIADSHDDNHSELVERYGDVDEVLLGVINKQEKSFIRTKQLFARAFGLEFIIDSGNISEKAAKEMTSDSFSEEFLPLFESTQGADNRKKTRSWLNYQERTLLGQRTIRPVSVRPTSDNLLSQTEIAQAQSDPVQKTSTAINNQMNPAEKMKFKKIEELEALHGHRVAGPDNRNQARIMTISNNDSDCLVIQRSNGSARIVVPKEYAEAVAKALDNGAKESEIKKILSNRRPVMTAKISGHKSGRPRRAVRY